MPPLDFYPNRLKKGKPTSQRKQAHLDKFLEIVRSLGVSLNVWKSADTKKIEWTSLLGGEKRIRLKKLPEFFSEIFPPERAAIIQKLWTVSKTYTKTLKQSLTN